MTSKFDLISTTSTTLKGKTFLAIFEQQWVSLSLCEIFVKLWEFTQRWRLLKAGVNFRQLISMLLFNMWVFLSCSAADDDEKTRIFHAFKGRLLTKTGFPLYACLQKRLINKISNAKRGSSKMKNVTSILARANEDFKTSKSGHALQTKPQIKQLFSRI